ncbi:MAG: hypothetical protein RDV48_20105 [Candidatus Eremiobacteraeota bacterium]|nr:hypothetical protein [Candidatus Eremiobacteraeota bacterium]
MNRKKSLFLRSVARILGKALLAAALLLSAAWSPAYAQWTIQELPLNEKVALKPSRGPLKQKEVPKMLARCFHDGKYVGVYSFKVQPGQRYTVYETFPCDGVERNIHLMGQTPFTDKDAYTDKDSKYWSRFPTHRSMVGKLPSKWDTYRTNFTIAPGSGHNTLYVVAVFDRPDIENYITLKHPADSDEGLSDSSKRIWGVALKEPLLLKNVPGTSEPAATPKLSPTVKPTHGPSPTPTAVIPATPPPGGGIFLQEAPISGTGAPVVPYNCKVKAYINKGDYDTFRVDFKGGHFKASSQGSLDLVADLWDARGRSMARAGQEGGANFTLEKELPAGTYYVHIRVMHHGGEGPYVLVLGNGTAGEYKEGLKEQGR